MIRLNAILLTFVVTYQLDLLHRVGFAHIELLHKNSCFAAFGAWKE